MTRRPLRVDNGRLIALALCLALSGCASAAWQPRGGTTDFWSTPLHDCSSALRAHPRFTVSFSVPVPGQHLRVGISVTSARLRSRIERDRPYPDLELRANGVPVHIGAHGEISWDGARRYYFEFDIEPLLRRYPDGFMLDLARGRRILLHADLSGARWAFGELLRCAAGRAA